MSCERTEHEESDTYCTRTALDEMMQHAADSYRRHKHKNIQEHTQDTVQVCTYSVVLWYLVLNRRVHCLVPDTACLNKRSTALQVQLSSI